ncbi:MAG: sulfurtransferase TusA family protein [Alphaproteobacteria bacterium]|nr:sulfurtransferase TusA family protein [Alphaproteobacteria bacterium]
MQNKLNTIGLKCPLPVLKTRKALNALPSGTKLEVRTSDPAAIIDMPHYCNESGNRLISQRQENSILVFIIEKT